MLIIVRKKREKRYYFIISWVPYDVFTWEPCEKTNTITRIVPWQFPYEDLKWNELWLIKEMHAINQKSSRMTEIETCLQTCELIPAHRRSLQKKNIASVHVNHIIKSSSLPLTVEMEALTKRRTSHPLDPPITSGSHLIGRRQRL